MISSELVTVEGRASLISVEDVESEVLRFFDGSDDALVVSVHGGDQGAPARAEAFRELLASLKMYDPRYEGELGLTIEPPSVPMVARALGVLSDPEHQRRLFREVLLCLGEDLLTPFTEAIEPATASMTEANLSLFREQTLSHAESLPISPACANDLAVVLRGVLTTEYLSELVARDVTVRETATQLARQCLRLIGTVFQRAFRDWPAHAERVAEAACRRLPSSMKLRDSPMLVRDRIVEGVEEFLWVETSTELEGALTKLFEQEQFDEVADGKLPEVSREAYNRLAHFCWSIIAEHS